MASLNNPISLPNSIISCIFSCSSLSSSFIISWFWAYFRYLLFILAILFAIVFSFSDFSAEYSGSFPLFLLFIQSINCCKASISFISYPYSTSSLLLKISLLFTKSITIACFPFFLLDIHLPTLCVYTGLLSVLVARITPETLFKWTPSSIIPTQYINFKWLDFELLKLCNCSTLVLSCELIPYISGSSSIFPNHSLALAIFSFMSLISLQNIIYFPSFSLIFSSISCGIPGAFADFKANSSYIAFNSSFLAPSACSICSSRVFNSSSLTKSGTTYFGGYIIPSSIASSRDFWLATASLKILSTTFAPSCLIGVADSPNNFACGLSSKNFLNFFPHLFSLSILLENSSSYFSSFSTTLLPAVALMDLVFKWCISSTIIIVGFKLFNILSTLCLSP